MSDVKGSRKRKSQGEHEETLEYGLLSILDNWRERNVEVTRKADEIAERVGEPKVSDGWLSRWQSRHSIIVKILQGEDADADQTSVDRWRKEKLPGIMEESDLNTYTILMNLDCFTPAGPIELWHGSLMVEKEQNKVSPGYQCWWLSIWMDLINFHIWLSVKARTQTVSLLREPRLDSRRVHRI